MITLIPDGYTDCSFAINRAIQTLPSGGGEIVLPAGNLLLTKSIIVDRSNVRIRGAGREITRLMVASKDGLGVVIGNDHAQVSRIQVADLTVNTTTGYCSGAGIRAFSVVDIRINNCLIANLNCGIEFENSSFAYVTDVEILDPQPGTGVGLLIHGNGIHNDQYLTRVFVQCRKQMSPCQVGYRIVNTQGFWMNECGAFHTEIGIHLMAQNEKTLEHVFMSNNAVDSCTNHGVLINAGLGGTVRRVQSMGDWSSSHDGHGILIDAGTGAVDDIKFIGARLYGNGGDGLCVNDAGSVSIDNSSLAGNGRNGSSSGITIAKQCNLIAIRNNTIGAFSGYENTQAYAIAGLDLVDRALVTGNVFEANRNDVYSVIPKQALIANNLDSTELRDKKHIIKGLK